MTSEEAIKLGETKFWEDLSMEQIAKFQLFEDKLCMPFKIFHEAIEKTLGRPVFTHELGLNREGLMKELMGTDVPPTMQEIIALIPEDKRVLVTGGER